MPIRVLLLSASFGDGHNQVARALRETFVERGLEVQEVDFYEKTNPYLAKVNVWIYEVSTRYFPVFYGLSYTLTAKLRSRHWLWTLLTVFTKKAVLEAVSHYQPDIVLQLFPDHAVGTIPRTEGRPFVGVVMTDFSVHSRWFPPSIDVLFVPSDQMSADIAPFIPSRIDVVESGIPVRQQFRDHLSAEATGHPNRYVLVSTGGRGLFPDLNAVLSGLLSGLPDYDVYVMCGRNTDMLRSIERRNLSEPRLHGVGYVENVAWWYRNADLVVGKSGGVTISECLAAGCAMVLYRPQPGQEADNAAFIERMGAGMVVQSAGHFKRVLEEGTLLARLDEMRSYAAKLARPDAAQRIAGYVLERIDALGHREG